MLDKIINKVSQKERITREEITHLYTHASDEVLAELACQVKSRFHPLNTATYLKMAILNFTNVCIAKCDYCAFYRLPHQAGGYTLSTEQLLTRVGQAQAEGCTMIGFNAGFNPKLSLKDYVRIFTEVRKSYPDLQYYEMTVAEFMFYCKKDKLSYADGALLLKENGTEWVPGGGAEILDDAFRRRHSPGKYKVDDYFQAQAAVLQSGLGSTATMVIGFDETLDERLNHLDMLRAFQDKMEMRLPSFLCWTYKPYNTEFGGKEVPAQEYLRWLALCRIYLDNFVNIRTSVLTRNEDALIGLEYGANDFDLPTEDEVTEKAGAFVSKDYESVLNFAKNRGFATIHRPAFSPFPSIQLQ